MDSLNKLHHAFETLRQSISRSSNEMYRQKLKSTPCLTITELISKSTDKSALLPFVVTSLIQLLEEADSNNRLVIEESLNKIIRSSLDNSNHIANILISLIKILGNSTNERCLKAALWRFAKLSHFIRPQKGKIYAKTLIPLIIMITKRREEMIHETLSESLPSIFQNIGLFTSDNQVKVLLKTFFKNLSSESIEIRRSGAFCIISTCKFSRKPHHFFRYTLLSLIDFLVESQCFKNTVNKNGAFVQGCLFCIHQILLYSRRPFEKRRESGYDIAIENLLQIYELCLFCINFVDHNVVTGALETLGQLLQHNSLSFRRVLTSKGGFPKSMLVTREKHNSTLSLSSHSDVSASATNPIDDRRCGEIDAHKNDYSSESIAIRTDVNVDVNSKCEEARTEKWIQQQISTDVNSISFVSLNMNTSHFACSDDEGMPEENNEPTLPFLFTSQSQFKSNNDLNLQFECTLSDGFRSKDKVVIESNIADSFDLNLSPERDIGKIFDECEIPLYYCSRFLVSKFLLEHIRGKKRIRVSVLSLVLNCFNQIMRLYPSCGLISVERFHETGEIDFSYLLEVIFAYSNHEDHQIRGHVRIVMAGFISSSLMKANILALHENVHFCNGKLTNKLVILLSEGLADESFICIKQSLHAVLICLESILRSSEFGLAVPLVESLLTLIRNPYWLIKTKILEIVENLPYELLYYVTDDDNTFQERILETIILSSLRNSDGRVRSAAALSLSKFIKKSYYPLDHQFRPVLITHITKTNMEHLPLYLRKYVNSTSVIEQRSLSRVVHRISDIFSNTSCKYALAGCCEALALLVLDYPPIQFPVSWQCYAELSHSSSSSMAFHEKLFLILNETSLSANLDVHLYSLRTVSQLFIALCENDFKYNTVRTDKTEDCKWSFLNNCELRYFGESFLQHVMRLINIINDIVTDQNVKCPHILQTAHDTTLPLPTDELIDSRQSTRVDFQYIIKLQPERKLRSWNKDKIYKFSQYNHLFIYLNLKKVLLSAYKNYEVTLKPESNEKFIIFLKTVLEVLSSFLSYTTKWEVDRVCKDLLNFLHNVAIFLPVQSIQCVKQLLRNIFGTNTMAEYIEKSFHLSHCLPVVDAVGDLDFYMQCIEEPQQIMNLHFENNSRRYNNTDERNETNAAPEALKLTVTTRKSVKRNVNINIMSSYIKLFEANVIESLKNYTITNNADLQSEVLLLLSELIQLKVNYCLLDSEHVFITFVLSQFQLIEEEQLPYMDTLLPSMFSFLIHLANEKHLKPVMTVPKIIQLCDSLIASIPGTSQCILAIENVVNHVFLKSFLMANTNEIEELKTQREVLFTMLLKLVHNIHTFSLFILILNNSEGELKLKRSQQIMNALFNALKLNTVYVEPGGGISQKLQDLLFSLHPLSFDEARLWNFILEFYDLNRFREIGSRSWISILVALLIVLLCRCNEKHLIETIQPTSLSAGYKEGMNSGLLVVGILKSAVTSVKVFIDLLCNSFLLLLEETIDLCLSSEGDCHDLSQNLSLISEFIILMCYIVKSGKFPLIKEELFSRNDGTGQLYNSFVVKSTRYIFQLCLSSPCIFLRWRELALYAGTNDIVDSTVLGLESSYMFDIRASCCKKYSNNLDRCGLLAYAKETGNFLLTCCFQRDQLFSNACEIERFLNRYWYNLISLTGESVVRNLLLDIIRSAEASRAMIAVIEEVYPKVANDILMAIKVLECLQYCCDEVSGACLLLCFRLNFLNYPLSVVSSKAYNLIIKLIGHLRIITSEEDFKSQLQCADVEFLLRNSSEVKDSSFRIISDSLRGLAAKWQHVGYATVNLANRTNQSGLDNNLFADHEDDKWRKWFLNFMKDKCFNANETKYVNVATMLGHLHSADILAILSNENFNKTILPQCILVGVRLSLQEWHRLNFDNTGDQLSDLYLSSGMILLKSVEHMNGKFLKIRQLYAVSFGREAEDYRLRYTSDLDAMFSDTEIQKTLALLMPAVNAYFGSIRKLTFAVISLPTFLSLDNLSVSVNFAVLCLEYTHWQVRNEKRWSRSLIMNAMQCSGSILSSKEVVTVITTSQIGSIVSCLYLLTRKFTKVDIKWLENPALKSIIEEESCSIQESVHAMSVLIEYFITEASLCSFSSSSLFISHAKILLVGLSRSPLVYDYLRIPLELWPYVTKEDIVMKTCLTLNKISENFLQDGDILQNFISRLMFFGWNSRMQFEESWMTLLTALNSLPEQETNDLGEVPLYQIHALTISAVTSLLVQTMYFPIPGCKLSPHVFHVTRNPLDLAHTGWRSKLSYINEKLKCAVVDANKAKEDIFYLFDNISINLERLFDKHCHGFNQISVEYLVLSLGESDLPAEQSTEHLADQCLINPRLDDNFSFMSISNIRHLRCKSVGQLAVDTNSCVYFLMDFYSRWLLKSGYQQIQVVIEIVNSLSVISDLFVEITQFGWLLECAVILWKRYASEDHAVRAYLTVVICKAASVFTPTEAESKRLILAALRSGLDNATALVRTCSLHALLYLLERIFKTRFLTNRNEKTDKSFEKEIVSIATNYVLENLQVDSIENFEEKIIGSVVSVAYYLVESGMCNDNIDLLIDRLLRLSVRACKQRKWKIHTIILQGLYNLIVQSNPAIAKYVNEVTQLVNEILSTAECTTYIALLSLQMLAALIYASEDVENTSSAFSADDKFDSEKLITRVEKISILFDRLKRCSRSEAQLVSSILPHILNDLFPPSEILNKIILEFLSPRQLNFDLLATTVFQVFQHAIQQSQLDLIQDWVLSLLSNLSNYSSNRAVFYLKVFFTSACTNHWIIATFPAVSHSVHFENDYDGDLLCASALQFYSQLKKENQKKKFIETLKIASINHGSYPFEDILSVVANI